MAEVVTMPKLGFDMAEGTLIRWVVAAGESVAKGAVLAEIETDKATVEVESAYDGVLIQHLVSEGEIVPVNTPIAVVGAPGEAVDISVLLAETAGRDEELPTPERREGPTPVEITPEAVATEAAPGEGYPGGVKASPLARRMAREHGVDLKMVQGSGAGGRITKKDLEAYLAAPPALVEVSVAEAQVMPPVAPAPVFSPVGPPPPDERIPLNRLRAIIGRRMVEVKQQVPHFYVTYEYDMAAVMDLRSQVNGLLPEGEKTSVNDYIVKAAALALREYPNLNASLDGDQILRHGQVNIGVAVAVESGLLTVVCRDADRKSIRQISAEIRTMAGRARVGKVRPDDIEGSTFSISNLGMFEVEHFIAIINPPEAAILAVGAVRQIPVVAGDQIVPGTRMKATISVDHRVSDGAEAARFLQALARYLEEPLRLMV